MLAYSIQQGGKNLFSSITRRAHLFIYFLIVDILSTNGFLLSVPVEFEQKRIDTLAARAILRPRNGLLSRLLLDTARMYNPVSSQL